MANGYQNWPVNLLVVVVTALTVTLVVLLHYECLVRLSRRLGRQGDHEPRRKVLYGIYVLLLIHIVEIWIFGCAGWVLLQVPGAGQLAGLGHAPGWLDAVYLSAMTYTTVGFGDLAPVGPVRFLAGTEALTGLVLITWSASFTYLEMERFWRTR
ncbi:MAG: hypothetical protein RL026_1264 [Pseudomonadota bacterium]|jgi:hypothetical protein